MPLTRGELFDMFYQPQKVVRSGGGRLKTKIQPVNLTQERMREIEIQVKDDPDLKKYYETLKNKMGKKIAPPPRPTN